MNNKVVVHFSDGKLSTGETGDFFPNKTTFHLKEDGKDGLIQIDIKNLKAIYFVESFTGNSTYKEKTDVERAGFGRKIKVQFKDGETQYGYTQGYTPNRPGFFVSPCDPNSNNLRIFVVTEATTNIQFV